MCVHPVAEGARFASGIEHEDRGTLHVVALDGAGHAAAQVEHLHAAIVRSDQRPFGGGQRNDELTLRMLAVDLQGARETKRNLRDPGEVLDVALGGRRVKRVLVEVLQLDAADLLDEPLPLGDDTGRIVVLLGIRDSDCLRLGLVGHVVLHLERQPAQSLHLDRDLDLVGAVWEQAPGRSKVCHLSSAETPPASRQ